MAGPIKKKFFEIEIPLTNSKVDVLAYSKEELENRTIKLDLTRQLRGKSIEIMFLVKLKEGKAIGEPRKLNLMSYFIRRMLRKNISYVEDSFSAECEDSSLRIKPFMITRKKVSRRVRKALRELAQEWIIDYVKDKKAKDIFSEIISNRLQKSLSVKLKKIYPLALCEIRVMNIEHIKEQEELKIKEEKIGEKPKKSEKKLREKQEEKFEEENKEEIEEKTTEKFGEIEKEDNEELIKKKEKKKSKEITEKTGE